MERLRTIWDSLRISLWFVPSVMLGLGVVLVLVGFAADARLTAHPGRGYSWFVYTSRPDQARDILSTLLATMITMASLVFSVMMVVLTLAASQFGPRLIRSFMASPHTQFVLGAFITTIVYCLLVLPSIGRRENADGPLPYFSVTIALALTLISVVLLVVFLHTLARSIVSETVIERVGRELDERIARLNCLDPEAARPRSEEALPTDFNQRAAFFGPTRSGYVQAISFEGMVETAQRSDVLIGIVFRPGDYVAQGGAGIGVYPRERCDETLIAKIDRAIVIGAHRTPVQDLEFSMRHLVEIAVRALSPAINDPYTAIAVADRLSASLALLMRRGLPEPVFEDSRGDVRVVRPVPTYSSLIGAGFDQIRQHGAAQPLVAIHLLEAIARIAEHASLPDQRDALSAQARAIAEAAYRDIPDGPDRDDVRKRMEFAEKALSPKSEGTAAMGRSAA